ncbi:MAG: DUF4214 domain-containing protein [Pseudomonas sp.]
MAITTAQIQQLYVAYLGRAADKAGLDYWANQLNTVPATLTLENLRANFVNEQPEYANAYAGLNREETVSKIYLQLFGHPADAAGLAYWTTGGGATVNADQLLTAFVNGASATDAKVVANKVLVAEVYTSTAGTNYVKADATSIIADVKDTSATVTTALGKLEDGSLSGLAIPTGLAAVKAAAIAESTANADAAAKVTSLTATNDKVVALNAEYKVTLTAVDGNSDKTVTYAEASTAALNNAKALYSAIAGGPAVTIDALKKTATDDAAALKTQYDALVNTHVNAVAEVKAYNAAFAANAKLAVVTTAQIDTVTGTLQGAIDAGNGSAFSAAAAKYALANPSAAEITSADELYAAIKGADAATVTKLDTAFNTGVFTTSYASVKSLAVEDGVKAAATKALADATTAVTSAYADASEKATDSAKVSADAQKADALVTEAKTQIDAHKAVTDSHEDAVAQIPTFAHDLDATVGLITAGNDSKADLFFFSAIKETDDLTITNFNKGDALYIGEGYTLNTAAKIGTDNFVTGSNTAVKEVFFTQDANGVVSVNIETNALGHVAGAGDNIATITLSGITSLTDVSYSNGIVMSNHVAVA